MSNTQTFSLGDKKPRLKTGGKAVWTELDKQTVLDLIRDYPDNLAEAFRQAVPKIKKSFDSISAYYYKSLAKKNNILAVGTKKGFSQPNVKNRSNKSNNQSVFLKPQLQHLHKILIDIMQMTEEEKEKLKTFVNTIL